MAATHRSSPRSLRGSLPPLAGSIGGVLLYWKTHSSWSLALAGLALGLLATAWVQPRLYLPIEKFLHRVQQGITQTLSWLLLGLIFVLIFIPGRLLVTFPRRSSSRHRKLNTYWRPSRTRTNSASFRRQY